MDTSEYRYRRQLYVNWEQPILLNVCIELLRHDCKRQGVAFESQDGEMTFIWEALRDALPPEYFTLENVNYHFENFKFPALDRFLRSMRKYSTNDTVYPEYDGLELAAWYIQLGGLVVAADKAQGLPLKADSLFDTLRWILEIAREYQGRAGGPTEKQQVRLCYDEQEYDDMIFRHINDYEVQKMYHDNHARSREHRRHLVRLMQEVGF